MAHFSSGTGGSGVCSSNCRVVMRKGYPVEISKVHLGRAMIEKSVFLTCVVLLGFIENASIRKRNR